MSDCHFPCVAYIVDVDIIWGIAGEYSGALEGLVRFSLCFSCLCLLTELCHHIFEVDDGLMFSLFPSFVGARGCAHIDLVRFLLIVNIRGQNEYIFLHSNAE